MSEIIDFIIVNAGWIIAVIAFCVPPIRDFVIRKFQLSLDKALENKKSLNDRKNYISKIRFDTEFQIYKELSGSFYNLIKYTLNLQSPSSLNAPVFSTDQEREDFEKKLYNDTLKAYIAAQDRLDINAVFIQGEFYLKYSEILTLCIQKLTLCKKKNHLQRLYKTMNLMWKTKK